MPCSRMKIGLQGILCLNYVSNCCLQSANLLAGTPEPCVQAPKLIAAVTVTAFKSGNFFMLFSS